MNAAQTEIALTASATQFVIRNPATQAVVGSLPIFSAEQIGAAVSLARHAQPRWAATPAPDRLKIIRRFQQLLCEQKDAIADTITREAGKPLAEALSTEIMVVLDGAQYLLNNAPARLPPEPVPPATPVMTLTRRRLLPDPSRAVSIISPPNYPLSMPSVRTLTTLAMGNGVVLQPS